MGVRGSVEGRRGQPPHQLLAELKAINLSFKGLELLFAPPDFQTFHWHCIMLQWKSRRVFRKKKIKRDKKVTREANKKVRKCNRISLEKTNAEITFFYINSLVVI